METRWWGLEERGRRVSVLSVSSSSAKLRSFGTWGFLGFGAGGLEGRVVGAEEVSSSSLVSARRRKLRDLAVDMVVE